MLSKFVVVSIALLSTAILNQIAFKPLPNSIDEQRRRVEGQVLISTDMPAVKLRFDKEFKYVGTQSFILYDVANAEQHFFVDADDQGRIKSMYLVQFEGYLANNQHVYDYEVTQSVKIGDLDFIADSAAFNIEKNRGRPDSDSNRARAFLEKKGYRIPGGDILSQRLVHLVDQQKRNELMIVYMEDLGPMKVTAADIMPKGQYSDRWDKISKGLLDRALKGVKVTP